MSLRALLVLAILASIATTTGGGNASAAPPALRLGAAGASFTLDGKPHFLILVSDFDALDTPDVDRDFTYLSSRVDGVRIFPNWWDFGSGHCPLRFSPRTVIGVREGAVIARP